MIAGDGKGICESEKSVARERQIDLLEGREWDFHCDLPMARIYDKTDELDYLGQMGMISFRTIRSKHLCKFGVMTGSNENEAIS